MIGNLRERWVYTWSDIWEPLGNLTQAPRDLYIQIYRICTDYLHRRPNNQILAEIVNNPEIALIAFQSIQGERFQDEIAAVQFLERTYEFLADINSRILLRRYVEYVTKFMVKYNLRYEVVEPFALRIRLPALYGDIYEQLRQINVGNPHLAGLMNDFEIAFTDFVRTRAQRDLTISLMRASNYAEGIALVALNRQQGTLGRMCDQLAVWPHPAMREVVKKLYEFCCDYPGIRHGGAGNNPNRLRTLEVKDTIIVSALFFAASGYLNQQVRLEDVIS